MTAVGDDENAGEYFLSELFVLIVVNVHEGWLRQLWEMMKMLQSIFCLNCNAAEYFLSELFVLIAVNVHLVWLRQLWEMMRMLQSIFCPNCLF